MRLHNATAQPVGHLLMEVPGQKGDGPRGEHLVRDRRTSSREDRQLVHSICLRTGRRGNLTHLQHE